MSTDRGNPMRKHLTSVVAKGEKIPFASLAAIVTAEGVDKLARPGIPVPFDWLRGLLSKVGVQARMPWREAEHRLRHTSNELMGATMNEIVALARRGGAVPVFVALDVVNEPPKAREAWLAWYATTPDAPCIAICSTAQGDAVCKGCGRTEDEVQHWPVLSPGEKRAVWRRMTQEGTAWRFNRYAERARAAAAGTPPAE